MPAHAGIQMRRLLKTKALLLLQKKKQKNFHLLGVVALAGQNPLSKSFLPLPAEGLSF
jgi:hypothetical protein